jgi:hypothetical protein
MAVVIMPCEIAPVGIVLSTTACWRFSSCALCLSVFFTSTLTCIMATVLKMRFAALSSVFTLSLHHRAPGFFPGSGDEAFVGTGRGLGFTKNVVLPRGTDDAAFLAAFEAALVGGVGGV